MGDFISLLPLTAPLDRNELRRLAIHACLELHRVRWLRSYVATDGSRMLCWYQAADAESVRLVLRQQGAANAPVWPAKVHGPPEPASIDSANCIVVELDLETTDGAGPSSGDTIAITAMENAGVMPVRIFLSGVGKRLICVVAGGDAAAVARDLESAGVSFTGLWPCNEFEPEPPRLFTSQRPPGPSRPVTSARRSAAATGETAELDAVIIGAGLSGICALERCLRMGLRARVYESGSDIGGVWYWNRYPGARVDSEVHTYGFSFSDELLGEWNWQELFAPQGEILQYLRYVVDRFELRPHIRLRTPVVAATYDRERAVWWVETATGERTPARYLIVAAGTLSTPQLPHYPGADAFRGAAFHTARWPAAGIDLDGKRVGIIGTGASGVQVIQTIAPAVKHLTVFQRTPTYCVPQRNRPLTEADRQQIRADWAQILSACHDSFGGFVHTFDPRSGLAVTAAEREAKFEELWRKAGFAFWFGNFADLMMNLEVNEHACEFLRGKIRARVRDPETARKLLPEHPFGTKRVPLENGYYESYNRSNVSLVDLRETPIERITPYSIDTSQASYPLDVIVYATGFDAGTGSINRIDVRGIDGASLVEKWKDGPRTFLGLLVSGFPNLFIVNGPHNAAALCNAGRCIEQNVDWIARCIDMMRTRQATRVVPTAAAEDEWTTHVYDVADASVLAAMKNSWFFGANTPGKPNRATIYAAGARAFHRHCEAVAEAGFAGLEFS